MLNFEYQNPTKVLFGKGQIAKISHEIPSDARILIVYDRHKRSESAHRKGSHD